MQQDVFILKVVVEVINCVCLKYHNGRTIPVTPHIRAGYTVSCIAYTVVTLRFSPASTMEAVATFTLSQLHVPSATYHSDLLL